MWLSDAGETTTHTNSRSCLKGKEGDGLNVAWRQGFAAGESSGPTHGGMGEFQEDGEDLRKRIHFARIYGTKPAFGNYGVQDYVFMEQVTSEDQFTFSVRAWKNGGSGSTKLVADGNKYCNMMGHEEGLEDYVWTWSTGAMIRKLDAPPFMAHALHLRGSNCSEMAGVLLTGPPSKSSPT